MIQFFFRLFLGLGWFVLLAILSVFVWIFTLGSDNIPYWYARGMAVVVLKIFGIDVEIRNKEWVTASGPAIIVGNHQSNFDVVVHGLIYPRHCVAIGKKEVLWVPVFGVLFWLTGNILLDRKNPEKAREGIELAKRALIQKHRWIYIFPEGTRSHSSSMGPFKKGAFHMAIAAQVPIIPVVASPTHALVDEKKYVLRKGKVHVHVLEPIPTRGMTTDHLDQLLETTRNKMVECLSQIKTEVY